MKKSIIIVAGIVFLGCSSAFAQKEEKKENIKEEEEINVVTEENKKVPAKKVEKEEPKKAELRKAKSVERKAFILKTEPIRKETTVSED